LSNAYTLVTHQCFVPQPRKINVAIHQSIAKKTMAMETILASLPPGQVQGQIRAIVLAILSGYRSRFVRNGNPIQASQGYVIPMGPRLGIALHGPVAGIIHDMVHLLPMVAANEIAT
jgi:hypothetical protein